MKTYIFAFFLLVFVQGFGQKRKKEDPKDIMIDSLTRTNSKLSVQLDSVSKDQKKYYGLYTTIKEKVIQKDFDPSRAGQMIDSMQLARDSASTMQASPVAALKDSLSMMSKENDLLQGKVDSLRVVIKSHASADKTKLMAELKDLKGLLDTKVINQAEYDAKKKLVMDKWQ